MPRGLVRFNQGDKIIYNNEIFYVVFSDGRLLWVTDSQTDSYNRSASGWYIDSKFAEKV